jgi:ankyrin repeat protein
MMKKSILILSIFLMPLAITAADLKADLAKAVEKDDIAAVKKLIMKGADVNTKDRFGWTPKFSAALKKDLISYSIM